MKLVITTQIYENYGFSEDKEIWKPKGGEFYTVKNLTEKQIQKIEKEGIPHLTNLINCNNGGFDEKIISYDIVEDEAKVAEDYQIQNFLQYTSKGWIVSNGSEKFLLEPNGGRKHLPLV